MLIKIHVDLFINFSFITIITIIIIIIIITLFRFYIALITSEQFFFKCFTDILWMYIDSESFPAQAFDIGTSGGVGVGYRKGPYTLLEATPSFHSELFFLPNSFAGHGVFTESAIKKGEFLVQYKGDLLTVEEADRRHEEYVKSKLRHNYQYFLTWKGKQMW